MPVVPISQRTQQAQSYQPAAIKPVALDLSPISDGAKQAAQVWQKTIDDADNAAAYQAATSAQSTLNSMLWDKDTGLFNTRRGEKAIGVADDGLKQFDAWAQQERGRLKNPRQVELFDKLLAAPRDGFQRQLLQHQSREFEAWQGETYKNAIQTAHEGAGLNYGDDNALDAGLIGLHGAIATRLQSQGAANLIGDEIKRATGDYYASAVIGAMANKDYARARLLLTRHDGELSQEQRVKLDGMLAPEEEAAKGMNAAEAAYAKFGPDKPAEADEWLAGQLKDDAKALDEARRQVRLKTAAYEDGQKVLISQALNQANTSGSYSFAAVPLSVRARLSPGSEQSLRQSLEAARALVESRRYTALQRQDAEENRAARDKARSAARDARKLYIDLSENPEALKAENIETHMQTFFDSGRLDLYERLRKMQGGLRGEVPGDFEQVKAGRGIVDRYLKPYKKTNTNSPKFDGREVNDVRQDAYIWMEGKIDEWKAMNPGQTITHADMEKLAAEGFVRGELTTDVGLIFDSKTTGFQFQADGRPFKPKNGPAPSSGKPETKKADPDSFTSISQIPADDRETLRRAAEVQGLTGKKAEAFMLNNYKTYLRSQ